MSGSPEPAPEPHPEPPLSLPGGVRTAGVLWVLVGALFVVGSCGGAVATAVLRAGQARPGPPNPAEGCTTWLGVLLGAGFFVAGLRIVRGEARDTLATSILSALVGLLYLGLGIGAVLLSRTPPPNAPEALAAAMLGAGVVGVVLGCGLLLPAGLGLAGRSRYLAWRAVYGPLPGRYRRWLRTQGRGGPGHPVWSRGAGPAPRGAADRRWWFVTREGGGCVAQLLDADGVAVASVSFRPGEVGVVAGGVPVPEPVLRLAESCEPGGGLFADSSGRPLDSQGRPPGAAGGSGLPPFPG